MGDNVIASPERLSGRGSLSGNTSPELNKDKDAKMTESDHPSPSSDANEDDDKPAMPMQKRRRVTRACDECRRKKIKCDGKQPCTHCTVYSYECTYDQPSNRRRNPAPQYIEALEQRLQKAEAILRAVLPGIDIEDPKFDAHGVEQIIESSRSNKSTVPVSGPTGVSGSKSDDDTQMQSMVDQTGSLELDDQGNWDFHGHTSGYMFIRRFRAKFGTQLMPTAPRTPENKFVSQAMESPRSVQSSPFDLHGTPTTDLLPPREVALRYCRAAIDDGCALTRPFHRPTFFRRLNSIYDTDQDQLKTEQMRFLPLLYVVMALGCLFSDHDDLDKKGYQSAIDQGYTWFNAGRSMLDITDCRDLISLQAVVFMIFFLQGSAKLATCYSYIGIALRACCRMGMHRKVQSNISAIESEERKRIFWLVRKLDTYVGTMLGLPQMLCDDDIDQEMPAEVHDDYIRDEGIVNMPSNVFPLMKATNAHTKLSWIMKKVLTYVYPLKPASNTNIGNTYTIGHSRIRELEQDLQMWMDELPMELRPSGESDTELSRVQQLLRMSYAYVQMMMYRPFLHYVSPACQSSSADKRSFACAAACVSVARNIVHITSEMRRRGLLGGAYWFVMYITYFAILSLVYFVLENPDSSTSKDILKDAREGRDTLASLSRLSFAADRCTQSLNTLFEELPDKLKERRASLQTTPAASRKRSQPSSNMTSVPIQSIPQKAVGSSVNGNFGPPNRARTMPSTEFINKVAHRGSLPNSPSAMKTSFNISNDSIATPMTTSTYDSPQPSSNANFAQLDWSIPQMQQNFPDLKNVMFPSNDPFAYGNQPISTLEESSFGGLQDVSFSNDQFNRSAESKFPSPQSMQSQSLAQSIDMASFERFQQQPPLEPSSFPGNRGQMFSNMGSNLVDEAQSMHQQQPPVSQPGTTNLGQEDYWTQQHHAENRGQFRTGLTPGVGGHGVNLDDLFGGASGWVPMNMGIDGLSMGMNSGNGQQHQHHQQQQQQNNPAGGIMWTTNNQWQ